MSAEDSMALEAAKLYSDDATFADIAEQLKVSKSHAQVLVRRGILLSMEEPEESEPSTPPQVNPVEHPVLEETPILQSIPFNQSLRGPESFILETAGIGRRIVLTPKAIMIFDLWKGGGFEGDLSDFLEDAVNFLYASKRPAERTY